MAVDFKRKEETPYAAALGRLLAGPAAKGPEWLTNLRQESLRLFEQTGFPKVTDEDWKYTNVAAIARTDFAPVVAANGTALCGKDSLAPFVYEEARGSILVFINGIFRRDLSSLDALPEALTVIDLVEAISDVKHEATIREALKADSGNSQNGFALLNTALFAGGVFIRIPPGIEITTPIHLQFISEAAESNVPAASFPRVVILGEA